MTTNHYIVLVVAAFLIYLGFVSSVDMFKSQKRLRAKKETWGKLNEISGKLKVEKDLKVWESLADSNEKKENIL